jgi:hypothetical protein
MLPIGVYTVRVNKPYCAEFTGREIRITPGIIRKLPIKLICTRG